MTTLTIPADRLDEGGEMNRQEALRQVAGNVAALTTATLFEELTGVDEVEQESLSEADEERLNWAIEEVQRRLRSMGQPRTRRAVPSRRT